MIGHHRISGAGAWKLGLLAMGIVMFAPVAQGEIPYRDDAYFESRRRTDVDPRLAELLVEWEKRGYAHMSDTTGPASDLECRGLFDKLRAKRFNEDDAAYLVAEARKYFPTEGEPDWEKLGLVFKSTSLGLCLPETYVIAQAAIDRIRTEASASVPDAVLDCGTRAFFVLAMSPDPVHTQVLVDAVEASYWNAEGGDIPRDWNTGDRRHILREKAVLAISGMPATTARRLLESVTKTLGDYGDPYRVMTTEALRGQTWDEVTALYAERLLQDIIETDEYAATLRADAPKD